MRLILNPSSGSARKAQAALLAEARRRDIPAEVSTSGADLLQKIDRAVQAGVERLILGGGDGTMHLALPALSASPTALGIVPLGRGNDLVRHLRLPLDPMAAFDHASTGPIREMDLGHVDQVPFITIAGTGFQSAVAGHAERATLVGGPLVYPWAVLRTLLGFKPPRFYLRVDGTERKETALLVAVANTPVFGGGMRLAPDARDDDGKLDLVLIRQVPKLRFLRLFPRVYRGEHTDHPAFVHIRLDSCEIRANSPLTFYGDGERLGPAKDQPARIGVLPGALRIVAPENPA